MPYTWVGRPRFTPILVLCVLVAMAFLSCTSTNQSSTAPEPVPSLKPLNVVLVTIDTLRADHLHCYGDDKVETPALDRLAREGTLFENAVAQTPLTPPSHASIFTGTYPTVHKVRNTGGFVLQPSCKTVASTLVAIG